MQRRSLQLKTQLTQLRKESLKNTLARSLTLTIVIPAQGSITNCVTNDQQGQKTKMYVQATP